MTLALSPFLSPASLSLPLYVGGNTRPSGPSIGSRSKIERIACELIKLESCIIASKLPIQHLLLSSSMPQCVIFVAVDNEGVLVRNKSNKLRAWARDIGLSDRGVARLLSVSRFTVASWRLADRAACEPEDWREGGIAGPEREISLLRR